MVDSFFWYSGIVAWLSLGVFGLLVASDAAIEFIVSSMKLKKEFILFVWTKLKVGRAPSNPGEGEG